MHAYIAGPLFNEGERWWDEQIEARVAKLGISTFLPHRSGNEMSWAEIPICDIFSKNVREINQADLVVANLNGVTSDDGTAWELGYAYAQGKHLVGVYTDMRLTFGRQVVNLMLECCLHKMVRSLDELENYLKDYLQSSDS